MAADPTHPPRQEGRATFEVGAAFYRTQSIIARDLAVLAAAVYRRHHGHLRVLDVMTGCGIRPLRYVLEAEADWVWANEGNPDLAPTLSRNLAVLPAQRYRITHQDANQVFLDCLQAGDSYDLVDIDNFGGPIPYTSQAMGATRLGSLLYLTNTDGRSTSGHDPAGSLRIYGAYARSHPAVHEQGLRLLIAHAANLAAARGAGIEPVFSLFTGQVHRVLLRRVNKPTLTDTTYGFLAYCHRCGHFQTVGWRRLGRVSCPCQIVQAAPEPGGVAARTDPSLVLSGPMWLGNLHDPQSLAAMQSLARDWGWSTQAKLLAVMAQEATLPPYYYPLGEIGRHGQMDIPNRDSLIAALQKQGFLAAVPHCERQAIKTNAAFRDCLDIAHQLSVNLD